MERFIVELRLPSGKTFARSPRLPLAEAESRAAMVSSEANTFTAHVVPAEKYAGTGIAAKATGEDAVISEDMRKRGETTL